MPLQYNITLSIPISYSIKTNKKITKVYKNIILYIGAAKNNLYF
jgi:hypothetical protein